MTGVAAALTFVQVVSLAVGLDSPVGAATGWGRSSSSGRLAAAPANPAVPRVAFTDDRDSLGRYSVPGGPILKFRDSVDSFAPSQPANFNGPNPPAYAQASATHEAQASSVAVGLTFYTAFVSTRDNANGDVYVSTNDAAPVRITCDDAAETHPVVSPDGNFVAYSSDAIGSANPGNHNIFVVRRAQTACNQTPAQLPDQTGDNEWPAWISDANTPGGALLAYSSDRDNPLGDLYTQVGGYDGVPAGATTRVTDGGGAYGSTQPFAARGRLGTDTPWVLLCTTTKFRSDGSLGEVTGTTTADPDAIRPVVSAWAGTDPPQGSEAAFNGTDVAFTSTESNPQGSVLLATKNGPAGSAPPYVFPTDGLRSISDGTEAGRPSSHPGWDRNTLLVTVRATRAEVSDAPSTNGQDRDTVAAAGLDNATPAYSPDGTQIAYSQRAAAGAATGRRLYLADSDDGANPQAVADGFAADAAPNTDGVTHYDLEPAWSPDGTKLAFVRAAFRYATQTQLTEISRAVWVADLKAGTAARVTPAADEGVAVYGHPSWSPDGTRLAASRSTVPADLSVALSGPTGGSVDTDIPFDLTATVSNAGSGPASGATLTFTAPAGVEFQTATLPTGCTGTTASVTCTIDAIDPTASTTRTISATATTPFTGRKVIATIASDSDYNPGNDTATLTLSTRVADLAITGLSTDATSIAPETTGNGGTTVPAQPTTIRVDLRNFGPDSARTPVLEVRTTNDASGISNATGCTQRADSTALVFRCDLTDFGFPGTRNATFTLSQTKPCSNFPTEIRASISSVTPDPLVENNSAGPVTVNLFGCGPKFRQQELSTPARRGPTIVELAPQPVVTGSQYSAAPVRGYPGSVPVVDPPRIWLFDAVTGAGAALRTCGDPNGNCAVVGRSPAWSPDGRRIAFDDGGQLDVAVLDGDPATTVQASDVVALVGFTTYASGTGGTPTTARRTLMAAHDPTWTADGDEIYFAGQPADAPDDSGIYAISPTGTNLRTVAQNVQPETQPTVQSSVDLAVTNTAVPSVIIRGAQSTVTLTITNAGPVRASGVVLEVTVPVAGLTPGTLPTGCTLALGTITCAVGTLAAGATRTVTFEVTGTVLGTYELPATVTTDSVDRVPGNNTSTSTVEVRRNLTDVGVTLTANPGDVLINDPSTLVATVRNNGSERAEDVGLTVQVASGLTIGAAPAGCTLAGATLTCPIGDLDPAATRTFALPVVGTTLGQQLSRATVTTTSNDVVPNDDTSTAVLVVRPRLSDLTVAITFTRPVGYVGGPLQVRFTVRNVGPQPAANATLRTTLAPQLGAVSAPGCVADGTPCALGTLASGKTVALTATVTPTPLPEPRDYDSVVLARVATSSDETTLVNNTDRETLPVRQPRVRLLPPIGPPGFVTIAFGEHLPPGARVRLRWSTGITSERGAVKVDADGTVQVPMLVVRRDGDLGERQLLVTSTTSLFTRISADMLVVARTQSPPDFVGRG